MNPLNAFAEKLLHDQIKDKCYIPDIADTRQFVKQAFRILFSQQSPVDKATYLRKFQNLGEHLERLLQDLSPDIKANASQISKQFLENLPEIYRQLRLDAEAIYRFDPAAASIQEVIHAYPGFYAIAIYRLSHAISQLHVPVLPRLFAEYAHSRTGIDIHPGAEIGESFFIDHGTGIVIGETTQIGKHVKIYQGVTLGALTVEKSMAAQKRHPTIEDHVIIYAGSTVLGGKTVVGHNSVIGGNVWLTESVPPYSVVYHKSEVHIRPGKNFQDPYNFCI